MTHKKSDYQLQFVVAIMAACMTPHLAFAQSTVGNAIANFGSNLENPLLTAVVVIAFAIGLYLIGTGLIAIADASSNSGQVQYRDGIIKMLIGSALMALPTVLGVTVQTVLGTAVYGGSANASVGGPQNCLASSGSGSLTCVLQNISVNVVPIAIETTFVMCWVFAVIILAMTLYQLSASNQRGGDAPKNWKMKLVLVGILADFPFFMSSIESSLGITNQTITSNGYAGMSGSNPNMMLAYQAPGGGALAQYSQAIGYAFVVISMFGVFYTLYGVGILMSENPRGSKWSGIVHILGGIALANPKYVTCFFINTLLGNTFGFC
jgi:hypothetical protein